MRVNSKKMFLTLKNEVSYETRQHQSYLELKKDTGEEFARMAYRFYLGQEATEKRKLVKILVSNCAFDSGKLYPTYDRQFDLMVRSKENDD